MTDTPSKKSADRRIANPKLRALINIGLELASERDSERLFQHVLVNTRDLFGATYVTIGMLDPRGRMVRRVVGCGTDPTVWIKAGERVPGILETVVAERRTVRGDNRGGDPATLDLPVGHPKVQAFLAAPIASPARVYGWICVVGNAGRPFTRADAYLIKALTGQVGRYFELEHEILERKQAESALRLERDRAQRYLDTAEVVLLALDLDGRITLLNRKGYDILEWTDGELLGRSWIDTCLPVRIRTACQQRFQRLVGGDLSIGGDHPILTRSGQERQIEWFHTVLRDDASHIVGTFSSGTDITARNRAQRSLRIAEERMRFALQNAGVGIWDMDFTTGMLEWSEILEAQYGLPPGTFAGTFDAFIERIHPDDREPVREIIAKATTSGADFSVQHRSVRPDGTVRWLNGAGRIHLDEHGEPLRGVGISQDVTERRTLEAQYQQAQRMEAIGRLAGGVAHDFNNLLTVILGRCELSLADLDRDDPRHANLVEIQQAGESAVGITQQLLAFSRQQIVESKAVDLNAVVADMQVMLGRLIGEQVKIVLVRPSEPLLVEADRGQVEQIILNLALNARDAMPSGGTVTIQIATVDLDQHDATSHLVVKPGRYAMLTVTDTGSGITPQVRARLFEPFFTTKEAGKGTGLGLTIVHGIARLCGGSIHVSSEVGRGTSFAVYLPRADDAEIIAHVPPPLAGSSAGTRSVLVVEDDQGLREVARAFLARQGYTALVAANADEAVQLFERDASIGVLLTDVVMPGASGPELTKQLVERRPALKVIYMSGYTDDAIVQHGVLTPGIAFLRKPFSSDALGRKIRDVLDQ
jgi:PAS domain S-box-containing protein